MSILTREKIREGIKSGEIGVDPFDESAIGAGSIDLRLGDKFRIFKEDNGIFDVNDEADYRNITELIQSDTIDIHPQETILGITLEKITLPSHLCGWLEGRSRFARLGLMVHISASFMQPGFRNHQVLEMTNMGHVPMRLHTGVRICQFVFQRTEGEARYEGKFSGQESP